MTGTTIAGAVAASTGPRIRGLDGLRGVVVLLVVAFHISGSALPFGGIVGVTTFFTLSGFLITRILLRERDETGGINLRAFYARRLLRLYPALLVLLVVTPILLAVAGDPYLRDYGWRAIASGLYVSNLMQAGGVGFGILTHTWSLAVEEQFYLLWPAALLGLVAMTRGSRKGLIRAVAGCLVLALAWRIYSQSAFGHDRVYYSLDTNAFSLLAGAMLGCAGRIRRAPAWVGWAAIAVLVGIAALRPGLGLDATSMVGVIAALTPAVALTVVWAASHGQRLLELAPLRWAGTLSYGIYLWHDVLLKIQWGGQETQGIMRVAAVVAAIAIALASYRWVEKPLLELKKRFERSSLSL